ncbi:OmpL47-type beta-barrel domain-containing protein [Treponema primitia]|uniref:OmpL47-type beta-barrel domain-containing protein n=1 Tax=Treponema primitia TaxID=88058 RepID=UPI00145F1F0A|nr:putative Ig domain-containing protein [Treponema primitia]
MPIIQDSYYHSVLYSADNTSPSVEINSGGKAISGTYYTNQNEITITGSASDSGSGVNTATWKYTLNGGEYNGGSVTLKTEGNYPLTFKVKDNIGNEGTKSGAIIIDRTNPTVSIMANPANGWTNGSSVRLDALGSDVLSGLDRQSWQYSTNGGVSWASASAANNSVTITNEEEMDVRFRVKDKAGNTGTASIICGVDKKVPEMELKGDRGGTWTAEKQEVLEIKASDGLSGMASLDYSLDNGSWVGISSFQGKITITEDGAHTAIFRAKDKAGNEANLSGRVNIDTTPPVFTASLDGIVCREDGNWKIPLKLTGISDWGSGFDFASLAYFLDAGNKTKLNGTRMGAVFNSLISVKSLAGGNHTIKVYAEDMVGNIQEQSITITVDDVPPVISPGSLLADTPEKAVWTNRNYFDYTIIDPGTGVKSKSVELKTLLQSGFSSAFSGFTHDGSRITFRNDAPDGTYQVLLTASDNANNIAERTFYFKLDRTPPRILQEAYKSSQGKITIAAFDDSSGVDEAGWYSVVPGVSGPGGYTIEAQSLGEGKWEKEFTLKDKAGNSAKQAVVFYIDLTPPQVSLSLPPYGTKEKLPVTISSADNLLEITHLWYRLDGAKTELEKSRWKSMEIALASLAEGKHTIRAGGTDEVGNSGEGIEYQFIIDRTPPELRAGEFRDGNNPDRILGKDDYTAGGGVLVTIAGIDKYMQGAEEHQGIIKYYSWGTTQKSDVQPVFSPMNQSEGNKFALKNLRDGINYVYVRAEDGAGNFSNTLAFILLQDQSSPGAPVIRSSTHAEARIVEQASFLSRGEFTFSPAFGIKSGARAYRYRLEKLIIREGQEGPGVTILEGLVSNTDQEGKGRLSLELEDNDEYEFYRLAVSCIGGNYNAGSEGLYRFRVDTEAPGDLRIQAIPQAESSFWYNQGDTLIRWNKPRDMTGVAEYRYRLSDASSEISSTGGEAELRAEDPLLWDHTPDTVITANLRDLLGDSGAGTVHVGVWAIDYAGNRKFGTNSFKVDFIPPEFKNTKLAFADAENITGKGKLVFWGKLDDRDSGVDHVTLLVTNNGITRSYTLGPDTEEYIISPLDDNQVFTVVLRAYDRAGNFTEQWGACATGNVPVPETYSIPYQEMINGYRLTGMRIIGQESTSYADIVLHVPDGIDMSSITVFDGSEIRKPLDFLIFEETDEGEGVFRGGRSGSGRYELRSGGFTLEGSVIGFDRTRGLTVGDSAYTRPVIEDGRRKDRTAALGTASVGNPPMSIVSSNRVSIGNKGSIESYTGSGSGFTLTDVEELGLGNGREWFTGEDLSFDRDLFDRLGISLEPAVEGETLRLRQSRMDPASMNLGAELDISADKPLNLTMADTVYGVRKGGLRGSSLEIYEAVLSLPQGYEPRELEIRNFIIDSLTGLVKCGPDFAAGTSGEDSRALVTVTIPEGGAVFEGTSIYFDTRGRLMVSGTLSSGLYGVFKTGDTQLTNLGINWESGPGISGFSALVHGFAVTGHQTRLSAKGIYVAEGTIDIWGNRLGINGLGLKEGEPNGVYSDGIITGEFSGDPGYGSLLKVSSAALMDPGLFGTIAVPLSPDISDQTGERFLNFTGAKLESDGAVRGNYPGERAFGIAGALLRAENILFEDGLLRIGKGSLEPVPNLDSGSLVFTGLSLNSNGVFSKGIAKGNRQFNAGGWNVKYKELYFDGGGINGRGFINLPEKLGSRTLEFPESRISPEGLFASSVLQEVRDILIIKGLSLSVDGVSLKALNEGYVLEAAYPLLSLMEINGPDILFGKTQFNCDGTVFLGEKEWRTISFSSRNGYPMETKNAGIENDGLALEGSLTFQWGDRQISFPAGKFYFRPDLSLTGAGPDTGTLFNYAGWSIRGENIRFDPDRIRIGLGKVLYREIEFNIGEIVISLEGKLFNRVISKQDISVSLFGSGARITETRFSEDGIEASVAITLPKLLGGKSFDFEKVGLRQNGEFRIEKKIDKIGFTAQGFTFSMEDIFLDENGLLAEKTMITLPVSMEGVTISANGVWISNTGKLTLENAQVSPFTLWNMEFKLSNFSIQNELVNLEGSIRLPQDIAGELAGREIRINDFTADLAGKIKSIDIHLDGEYKVPFAGVWDLIFRNVSVTYAAGQPWIVAEQVKLLFPVEYKVDNAYIDHVKFNPISGKFEFADITLEGKAPLNIGFCGIDFYLNRLSVNSERTIAFSGSVQFPASGMPDFIAGKTAEVKNFEIRRDGSLGNMNISLDGLEGAIIPYMKGLSLKKGSVSLLKEGEKSLAMSIAGNISFGKDMPEWVAGTSLKIDTFTFDTASLEITRLKASVTLPTANALGNLFSKLTIGIDWNEVKQTGFLNLSGSLILPNSFPDVFAGQEAKINNFKIGFDGVIQSFTAKYNSEKGKVYNAFSAVQLRDIAIEASLKKEVMKFDLAGTVILQEGKFPAGIGGLQTAIAMEFDTVSGLKSASASAALPQNKLFDVMELMNGAFSISKQEGSPLEVSIAGKLKLPDNFPEGLRGTTVNIGKFTINTAGEIADLNIGVEGLNVKIFNAVNLSNGRLFFKKGTGHEFLIDVGGKISITRPGLPEAISKASLEIRKFELSTKDGLKAFDVGLSTGTKLEFPILGGIKISVTSLGVSNSGLSLSAGAEFPSNYPGLANIRIALKVLKFSWDGTLMDIQGGFSNAAINIGGFTVKFEELFFERDSSNQFWVTLKSCRLEIPANFGSFGGQYVALKNAKFNPKNGSFLGDIEISKIQTVIAGFTLIMDKPALEFSQGRISFSKVTLKLPDFIAPKGELALKNVSLSAANGLQVGGGSIKLPSFDVGVLSFSNIQVEFSITDGEYILGGGGSVLIPGAGNIGVIISFATKSSTYPLGLKQAEFSYIVAMGGIPLGNSGLFLSGIKGGIAYGPPDEVPGFYRGMFNSKGPRLVMGLHVGDYYGGTIIGMAPTVWVDITNGIWAFEGTALVLRGALNISATTSATLGRQGFVGDFYVSLSYAEGGVTIYIFDKQGTTILSGVGYVRFGLAKGAIINSWLIKIPTGNMWLARISADFGRFSNGRSGFKGSVDLPLVGYVGVFVGPGVFDFGALSSYQIEKPSWTQSFRPALVPGENPDTLSQDSYDRPGDDDLIYSVFVPPGNKDIAAPLNMLQAEYGRMDKIPPSGLQRLIVILTYSDGAPELTVRSPSGIEYREGYPGMETVLVEGGIVFSIPSNEAGIWQLRVQELEEKYYELSVLGSKALPVMNIREPSYGLEKVVSELRVQGTTDQSGRSFRIFAREAEGLPAMELGTRMTRADGSFDVTVPVFDLCDGEYYICAEFETTGTEVSPMVYAPGKILVERSDLPLLAPANLTAAETNVGTLSLRWANANGGRTGGYKLRIVNVREDTESILYVGNITSLDLPGYEAGQELSFAICTLDSEYKAGPWSDPVTMVFGSERPVWNSPAVYSKRIEARGTIGGFVEGRIQGRVENFKLQGDASDYIGARYAGAEQDSFLNIHFAGPVRIDGPIFEMPWYMGIAETMTPGLYEYPWELFNEANGALSSPFTLVIDLRWPQPDISAVEPAEIDPGLENVLTIYGNGFMPGSRVFWEGEELAILEADPSPGFLRALLPRIRDMEALRAKDGKGELTLEGPGGDRARFTVTVLLPDWRLTNYTLSAETVPGGKLNYAFGALSLNGFEGPLSFRILEKPDELDISLPLPVLTAGGRTTGGIKVEARENAAPGIYKINIEGQRGKFFELITIVREELPSARLSSVVPRAAYRGEDVHLYGYGFGSKGTLYLNEQVIPAKSWSGEEIVFTTPDDGASGKLRILVGGNESNVLNFTVRERGFIMYPSASDIELAAGEGKTINITISGYDDMVELSTECEENAPFAAVLEKSEIRPGDSVGLTIRAEPFAANGLWKIAIRGRSRGFEVTEGITVRIGSSLIITTSKLPDGYVEQSYSGEIISRNARGITEYRVIRGSLPPGLSLSLRGIISGRPLERGQYPVEIEVQDGKGWKDSRSYTITVWEEIWGQEGRDGGRSRSVVSDLPASGDQAWTVQGNAPVLQILGVENLIIIRGQGGLGALRIRDGSQAWKIEGLYRQLICAGGRLYALTGETLEVRDPLTGNLLWTREGILAISSDGATLMELTPTALFFRNPARGTLIEERKRTIPVAETLWVYGTLYEIQGSRLIPLYGPGKPWDAGEEILAIGADSRGGVAVTAESLILFDNELREILRVQGAHSPDTLISLTEAGVSLLDRGRLSSYKRDDLSLQWQRQIGLRDKTGAAGQDDAVPGNGKEKTIVAGKEGLSVFNRYTGGSIWRDARAYGAFALYHEGIYAADTDGVIHAFKGHPNIQAPVTELRVTPAAPDGSQGWYTQNPLLEIISTDIETYAAEIPMQHNSDSWEEAPASLVLEDGEHMIRAYGVDTRGLRGKDVQVQLKVDSGAPESSFTLSPVEREGGWYNSTVTLSLEVQDSVSGIDWIWDSTGAYTAPVVFADQGVHHYSWYALDKAGNREEIRSKDIRIDFEPPLMEVSVLYDQGMGELTLKARDALSGVARIEYRVNNGPVEIYREPVVFMEEGGYRVFYRGVDRADNSGSWQACDVWVAPNRSTVSMIDHAEINGAERAVMYHAHNGMPLIRGGEDMDIGSSSHRDTAAMTRLPSYTLGAEYILWEEGDELLDERAGIRFRVLRDAVVYLFLPKKTEAPPAWGFVEERGELNRFYYPGGVSVYMRRYGAQAVVELPGTPAGLSQPLIMVQERGSVVADILVRQEIVEADAVESAQLATPTLVGKFPAQVFILEALVQPWQYRRRLPLRERWLVYGDEGWMPLEGNRWEAAEVAIGESGHLRFRLELYTPDGVVEYRAEKAVELDGDFVEEQEN